MQKPNNIKERFIAFFSDSNRTVFSGMNVSARGVLQDKILCFLHADTYPDAEDAAVELKMEILYLHGKMDAFRKALEDLDRVEKKIDEDYQRLHYVHQTHVFLLGLYLYDTFPQVKKAIDQEMLETSGKFLSGGDLTGEFLFRWRMASLVHDVGYALALLADNQELDICLQGFGRSIQRPVANPNEIFKYCDKNLLKQLSDRIEERFGFSLLPIVKDLEKKHPYSKTPPYYDHGILSAVTFLFLINHEYSLPHDESLDVAGYKLVWDKAFLDICFPEIAMAIALHNLDAKDYKDIFKLDKKKYYSVKNSPFSWLLKLCDTLQEWDKPRTDEHEKHVGPLKSLHIDFNTNDYGVLEVVNFPGKIDPDTGRCKEKEIIEGFTDAPIKISVILSE